MLTTTIKFKVSFIFAMLVSLTVTAQNGNSYLYTKCENETDAIARSLSNLNIKEPALNCDIPSTATSCTVDGKQLNTSSTFENACINRLKGRIYYGNIILTCSEAGKNEKKTFNYLNDATCFGMSCTDDQIADVYRALYYPALELGYAKTKGLNCTTAGTGGSKSSAITSKPGITNVAISATALLLLIAHSLVQ
jgi:hypothetical protein